jgi:hypothetical protein
VPYRLFSFIKNKKNNLRKALIPPCGVLGPNTTQNHNRQGDLMSYLSLGEPKFDMKVIPIFKTSGPTFTILDLSWVPEGTRKAELLKGFSF